VTPAELSAAVLTAVSQCLAAGDFEGTTPAEVVIERPKNSEHGDYSTNIALRLARPAGKPARELAAAIAARLGATEGFARVDVAGPGFLNITLAADALGQVARTIVETGAAFGRGQELVGQNLNLEFVSANPTGPVHIGAVRWAAVGDAVARLLQASGAQVSREYYFNDAGSQIERFALTLREVANGRPVPEDGYVGAYIDDIAAAVVTQNPGVLALADDEQTEAFRREGVELMFAEIKGSLAAFGVAFDVYFNERDLHERGALVTTLKRLRDQGNVYESEGATWLRTTDYGDDRDRVLVRTNGEWTYFAADCAYYLNKRERGFDKAVIMLGADHHGYINRLRAMVTCFGDDPDQTLEILIGQMVNLVKDGMPMRMSKRAGKVIVLADLVDAIGADAARYALVGTPRNRASTSTSTCGRATRMTTRCITCNTRTPGWRRCCAMPLISLSCAPPTRTSACSPTTVKQTCWAPSASSRGSWHRLRNCARHTASRTTSSRWPAHTTASTTSAACCRWARTPRRR